MWGIIDQADVIARLQGDLKADRLPHALLFTGQDGVGKRTVALALARALTCTGGAPPCGQCVHCRQIAGGIHPDVTVIERAEGKDSIAIQQVRVLRDEAALRPFQARRKIFIINGAEALTPQAADALLKTLEEPPPQVSLFLTASDFDALPATVVSRCRIVHLRPVPSRSIETALIARGADEEQAARIARLARGSIGWALQAQKAPKLLAQREQAVAELAGVLDLNTETRLKLAETLAGDRRDRSGVRRSLELLAALARDLLLIAEDLPPQLTPEDQQERIRAQAKRLGAGRIIAYLGRIRLTMDRIDQNVDPRLALEALLVDLP